MNKEIIERIFRPKKGKVVSLPKPTPPKPKCPVCGIGYNCSNSSVV